MQLPTSLVGLKPHFLYSPFQYSIPLFSTHSPPPPRAFKTCGTGAGHIWWRFETRKAHATLRGESVPPPIQRWPVPLRAARTRSKAIAPSVGHKYRMPTEYVCPSCEGGKIGIGENAWIKMSPHLGRSVDPKSSGAFFGPTSFEKKIGTLCCFFDAGMPRFHSTQLRPFLKNLGGLFCIKKKDLKFYIRNKKHYGLWLYPSFSTKKIQRNSWFNQQNNLHGKTLGRPQMGAKGSTYQWMLHQDAFGSSTELGAQWARGGLVLRTVLERHRGHLFWKGITVVRSIFMVNVGLPKQAKQKKPWDLW